jgi:hypothetical protein
VFWSPFCGPALQALPEIERVSKLLRAWGAKTVLISRARPTEVAWSVLDGNSLASSLYHDASGDATEAFNNWGTPEYYILDGEKRVRFGHAKLLDVPRQVSVLMSRSDMAADSLVALTAGYC